MFEDIREAVSKGRERMKKWKAIESAHKDEFEREVKSLDKRMFRATGIFGLASLGFVGLMVFGPQGIGWIYLLGFFAIFTWWFYRVWQHGNLVMKAEKGILRRHHYDCPFCGQAMQTLEV